MVLERLGGTHIEVGPAIRLPPDSALGLLPSRALSSGRAQQA